MGVWAFETTKWAVGNLNLGSWKVNLLTNYSTRNEAFFRVFLQFFMKLTFGLNNQGKAYFMDKYRKNQK